MTITVRDLDARELAGLPRHWLHGSATATGIANGVNLLFPWGERFFVRSVKRFADKLDDPELRAQIKGFFGQEGRHAHAHDLLNAELRKQGYQIDEFLASYAKFGSWLEKRSPAKLRLAVTAAAEHFTAIMAEGALARDVLAGADPRMQKLLAWHAAEEIEHKAVAFDVLQRVDPSYRLRMTGMLVATLLLGGFWLRASIMLLRQDGITLRTARRELSRLRDRDPIIRRVFIRGIREYLRRDFHPTDNEQDHLAEAWFAEHGYSMPEAA